MDVVKEGGKETLQIDHISHAYGNQCARLWPPIHVGDH